MEILHRFEVFRLIKDRDKLLDIVLG
jgi:hypothetical protein